MLFITIIGRHHASRALDSGTILHQFSRNGSKYLHKQRSGDPVVGNSGG